MLSLGQCITSNGSLAEDRKRLKRSWEAVFWRNARVLTCKTICVSSRMRFWTMISRGIELFRFSLWMPSTSAAGTIEGWHNLILQRIVRVSCEDGEGAGEFCRRRNSIVSVHRKNAGSDVKLDWAMSLARCVEHLRRHPECPAGVFLSVQDDLWLQTVRAMQAADICAQSVRAGRTGTRAGRGKPVRWGHFWVAAVEVSYGWENLTRDRGHTRARADAIYAYLEIGRMRVS